MNHFGEFLECARKNLRVSRKEMAGFLGWEVETYYLVVSGHVKMRLATRIMIKHIILDNMREERACQTKRLIG